MKPLSIALVVVTALVAFCPGVGAKRPEPPPGSTSLGSLTGIVVKTEEDGGYRWVTVVATSMFGGPLHKEVKKVGTLVPFRIVCETKGSDFPLGHRLDAECHFGGPNMDTESFGGTPDEVYGIVVEPRYGEKATAGAKPDFKAMAEILQKAASDEVRLLTIGALITLPGKRSSRTIEIALNDISVAVRLKAARALVGRKYKPAIERLVALLSHDSESELIYQIDVAGILAGAGYKEGLGFLMRHVGDESPVVVQLVAKTLGEVGGADEAARLKQLAAASKDKDTATAAREAAARIAQRLEEQE